MDAHKKSTTNQLTAFNQVVMNVQAHPTARTICYVNPDMTHSQMFQKVEYGLPPKI